MKLPALAILLLLLAGCGYNHSSIYPTSVSSIAVPTFSNKTNVTGMEVPLTKAVINQIQTHTPYTILPRDTADSLLEGEITSANFRVVSQDELTDLPKEQSLTLTVDFTWKDLRTGQILRERRDYSDSDVYYPTIGESDFVGQQALIEKLAVKIAQEMQADW